MKSKTQMSLHQALTKIMLKIEGSWGLIAFDRENPNSIIVSKNHQNFLLGLNKDSIYVSSEVIYI
jgi:glucosamine 6-phosphate synthetase-like amidotransferase/phosphosugar isomerase protein